MIDTDHDDALRWLYSLTLKGIKLDLENTKELLAKVDNPETKIKFIHVGGTDGKGSICACLASMLISSGIRTGLYTSPHIARFNERITVNGEMISDLEMAKIAKQLKPIADEMESNGRPPTFFEVTTAMAFIHFANKGVEYAVAEVGMGGRLDSTNVITPEVCVIGNISMDHEMFLGNTLKEIAFEKAGIIKPGVLCVTLNDDEVFDVLEKKAFEVGARIVRVYRKDIELNEVLQDRTEFHYKEERYTVSIPGSAQADNASLAIEAVSKLKIFGQCVRCNIKKGLRDVRWPCRLEKVNGLPLILDVTHTAAGSRSVVQDIQRIYGKVDVVLGMLEDKDTDSMIRNLSKVTGRIYISKLMIERTANVESMTKVAEGRIENVQSFRNISEAMDEAFRNREDRNILVTGSFHTAEEALEWLKRTYAGYWTYSQRSMIAAHTPEDPRKV